MKEVEVRTVEIVGLRRGDLQFGRVLRFGVQTEWWRLIVAVFETGFCGA